MKRIITNAIPISVQTYEPIQQVFCININANFPFNILNFT